MKVRNLLTGREYAATVTTDSSASSYGQCAVIVNGEPLDPIGIEITEVSAEEWDALPSFWWPTLAPALQD